jgi:hypothetical protein
MVIKRSGYNGSTERWAKDSNKHVTYEFTFKGTIIKPGTQLRLKDDYTTYTFACLVTDVKLNKTWMELTCSKGFRAKTIDRISRIVGVKRSYTKANVGKE